MAWKAKLWIRRKPSDSHAAPEYYRTGVGPSGWHCYPGPSLVIVKSGTATLYLANDPTCRLGRGPGRIRLRGFGGGDVQAGGRGNQGTGSTGATVVASAASW